jgi:predicted nucleotidyltransferase
MKFRQIAEAFKRDLYRYYGENLRNVILFGSMARDESREESDMDLLVVLNHSENMEKESERILEMAIELEKKMDIPFIISALPVKQYDYHTRETPLLMNVRKEGVVL